MSAATTAGPVPRIRLIERDAADRPFHSPVRWDGCAAGDLERHGYQVDEYLVAGDAHWYIHAPGRGAIVDPDNAELCAYRTRAYVVRPHDPRRFSGKVIVEQLNPSMRADFSMLWSDVGHLAMADGDVFVAFTYKKVVADNLKLVDPTRYGDLDIPSDRVAWDLFRDVLAVSRGADGTSILGDDMPGADNVIVTGGSQCGGFIHSFIVEGLHEPAGDGRAFPTADGYLINVASGSFGFMGFISLHMDGEGYLETGLADFFRSHECPLDDPRRLSRGLEVPVVQWLSETEALQDWWVARPDSDVPGDLYRCWQVPGRGHGSGLLGLEGLRRDVEQLRTAGVASSMIDFHPPDAHPESAFLLSALIGGMRRWRAEGVPMARVPRIKLAATSYVCRDELGFRTRGLFQEADELGHSLGGLRYPTIEHAVDRFVEEPSDSIAPDWRRRALSREDVARRYGSLERWLVLARGTLDRMIAEGTVRADHRELFLDYLGKLA